MPIPKMPLQALSPAQLRARARRLLEMADEFSHYNLGQLLQDQAAELTAEADALEGKS